MKKKIMSLLLAILMVIGLMPGMGLTAYADDDPSAIGTPTVSWDGKKISWTAVDGVTGYRVEAWTSPSGTDLNETVSADTLNYDLTSYVNNHGATRYTASVYPIVGTEEGTRGRADQYFRKVEVGVAFKTYPYHDYYEVGTDGGTVTVTTSSGETLDGPDDNGNYSGLIAQGAGVYDVGPLVTVTATPAEGYQLEKITERNATVSTESPYEFNVKNDNYFIDVYFIQDQPDPITITLKWSSIDGATKLDDKEIEMDPGQSFWEALSRQEFEDPFDEYDAVDDYSPLGLRTLLLTPEPITSYSSEEEVYDADITYTKLTEDTTAYVIMAKDVKTMSLSVEKPMCGDEVKMESGEQTHAPVVTAKEDSQIQPNGAMWSDMSGAYPVPFEGTIEGGKSYTANIFLGDSEFGYKYNDNNPPSLTVENADEGSAKIHRAYGPIFTVTAEHDWEDEGTVTKEPTYTEEGEMTYKCKHFDTCGGTKTEPIPKLLKLTLHFSSLDGDDIVEPIMIGTTPGTAIKDAVHNGIGKEWWEVLFTEDGYSDSLYRTPEPLTKYADFAELLDADIGGDTVINEDMDVYVCMFKTIDAVEITVTPPICGVETTTPEGIPWEWSEQTNPPVFSVPSGKNYHVDSGIAPANWKDMNDISEPFIGTFEGGETYKADYELEADFGYYFAGDVDEMIYNGTVKVNGGTFVETRYLWNSLSIVATLDADHDWDDGTENPEPTCTEKGKKVFACKHNGEDWHTEDATKTEDIDALGHDYHEVAGSAKEATCTEAGKEADQKCSRCGDVITGKEIKALGHDYQEVAGSAVEPTCTEVGKEADQKCSRCDDVIEGKEIKALGHDYQEVAGSAKEATCTEAGKEADQKCSRCDDVTTGKEIKALGHDYQEVADSAVEPTCTEAGKEADQKCSRCGDVITGKEIKALGHDYQEVAGSAVEPTCTEAGKEANQKCSRCGDVITGKEIAALGHDWGEWKETKAPTVDAEGEETRACSRCDETETRSIPKPDPEKISYRNTEGNGTRWTKGSNKTADFTFKRSENDSETFSHFTGIQVDGKDVDKANYTAESGSVIVKLKPAYLETLSVGEHTITALFDDGNSASAKFTIAASESSRSSGSGTSGDSTSNRTGGEAGSTTTGKTAAGTTTTAAKTGDTGNMLLWFTILCASMLVFVNVINVRRRNTIGRR